MSCSDFIGALAGGRVRGAERGTANGRKWTRIVLVLTVLGITAGFGVRWLDTAFKQRTQQEQLATETQAQMNALLGEAHTALNTGDLDAVTDNMRSEIVPEKRRSYVQTIPISSNKEEESPKAQEAVIIESNATGANKARKNDDRELKQVAKEGTRTISELKKEAFVFKLGKDVAIDLVFLESGDFIMGSSIGNEKERPEHTVKIDFPIWIGRTEITQAQYKYVVGINPSLIKGEGHPVENIDWRDASAYCDKLTGLAQKAGVLPEGYEFSLPTEEVWEYACRAGTRGEYSGTGDLYDMGWHDGADLRGTMPVKKKKANQWGLYDMHGNVWEWCNNNYTPNYDQKTNSLNSSNVKKVIRGGSWNSFSAECRSSARRGCNAKQKLYSIGFRVCIVESNHDYFMSLR